MTSIVSSVTGNTASLWPFVMGLVYVSPTTGNVTSTDQGGDIASYLHGMYAFYRGGVRPVITYGNTFQVVLSLIGFYTRSSLSNDTGNIASAPNLPVPWSDRSTYYTGWAGTVQTDSGVGSVNANIPYYSPMAVSLCTYSDVNNFARSDDSQPLVGLNMGGAVGSFTNFAWTRSFRDDFTYSYFIGCPPRYYQSVPIPVGITVPVLEHYDTVLPHNYDVPLLNGY